MCVLIFVSFFVLKYSQFAPGNHHKLFTFRLYKNENISNSVVRDFITILETIEVELRLNKLQISEYTCSINTD